MIQNAVDDGDSTVPGLYTIGRMPSFNEGFEEAKISSRVLLTISAKDLWDPDPDKIADPYCVVSICEAPMARVRQWREIGRTEIISNTSNPEWSTKICLTYYFEEQQRLQFEIYDKAGMHRQHLGVASMLLHEVVGAPYNRLTKPLYEEGKQHGSITVAAEELSEGRQDSIYCVVSATNLDKKDFLGKCDPFLVISRINYDSTLQLAYRSRYHEQTLNPKWTPFEILTQQLCYGDKDREFLIECYDWDSDGGHDLVGSCKTTVNRLLFGLDKELPLINEKKAAKKKEKYVDSGLLHFDKVYEWKDYTFLDFISGGTELDFMIAVDWTKSNLPMNDASSLHHYDGEHANQYEMAIEAIAEICQHYNRNKCFNAYGFGARIPPDNKVHYQFPLNLETHDPRCYGVEALLQAYLTAQSNVELAGPSCFTPTIHHAARRAASLAEDGSKYCVLLILTDGVVADMEETKAEIVRASSLPLSIIIIGVGYDAFKEMKVLDADETALSSHGRYARRDIVQFVQMRKFLPPHRQLTEEDMLEAKARLAKEVLLEVPAQLVAYMKSKGIRPRPPAEPFERLDYSTWSVPPSRQGSIKRRESMRKASLSGRANLPNSPRTPTRRLLPNPPDEAAEELARTRFFQ